MAVLQADVKLKYGVYVSKQKVYRAKKKALAIIGVDYEDSYKKIRDYTKMIFDKMPEPLVIVQGKRFTYSDIETIFNGFMVAFPTIREGFNNRCRPFIGTDGCHQKVHSKGFFYQ